MTLLQIASVIFSAYIQTCKTIETHVLLEDPMDEWYLHWTPFDGITSIKRDGPSECCSSSTCFKSEGIKFDEISTVQYTNIRTVFDIHIQNLNPTETVEVYYNVNGMKQTGDMLVYNDLYNDQDLSTQTFHLSNEYASNKCELSIVFDFIWDGTYPRGPVFCLDNFYIYGDYIMPKTSPSSPSSSSSGGTGGHGVTGGETVKCEATVKSGAPGKSGLSSSSSAAAEGKMSGELRSEKSVQTVKHGATPASESRSSKESEEESDDKKSQTKTNNLGITKTETLEETEEDNKAIGNLLNDNNSDNNSGYTEESVMSFSKNAMIIWALVIAFLVLNVVIAWCCYFKSKKKTKMVTFEDEISSKVEDEISSKV